MWHRLRPYLYVERKLIGLTLVIVPIISALNLFQPYLVKVAVDQHILKKDLLGLRWVVLGYFGLFISEYILNYLQILFMQLTGQRIIFNLRKDLFAKIQRLPRSYLEKTPTGVTVSRITSDCDVISEMFSSGIVSLGWDCIRLILIVSMMLYLNVKLALVAFSILPVLIFSVQFLRKRLHDGYDQVRKVWAHLNGFVQEHIQGIRIIQLFIQEKKTNAEFSRINNQYRDVVMKTVNNDAALYAVVEALSSVALGLMIWYGSGQWLRQQLSLGVLIAFIEYVQRFFVPIRDLSAKVAVVQSAQISTERIFSLLEEDAETLQAPGSSPSVRPFRESIQFVNASFSYQKHKSVLNQVSFQIKKGERIGLVGVTGSGKTTIFKLLGRHYLLASGSILIDGENINQVPLENVRQWFCYVPQDVFLFSGSVLDNIRLFDERFTLSTVEAVVRRTGIGSFIDGLEKGYLFEIKGNGGNLSMGQRQLIALARAFLFDTPVLLLDEVTSYMDPQTSQLIQHALQSLSEDGRTLVVSSHRLSTLKNVDRMIILHQGKVQDIGSPQDLAGRENVLSHLSEVMAKLTA